ncbi:MAG: ABC transporter permease [Chloroflexota bacterium]|nr:MAG: ABC transporter permease [Chloroflexota bacterium]
MTDARATIIEPSSGWRALDVAELWRYRELLYFLAWRDVKVRYKQAALGIAWAVIQPVAATLVFALIFGRFAGLPSDGSPYVLFAFIGVLCWTYFANAVAAAGTSLVANTHLVSKVYFPRLLVPLSAAAPGLIDLLVGLVLLLGLVAYFGVPLSGRIVLIPFFLAVGAIAAVAVGIWLAALDVRYRDVRYVVPFLLQVWMFGTPVVYSSSLLPEAVRPFYSLNPMVGVIDGCRWAILGGDNPPTSIVVSFVAVLLIFVSGVFYFHRVERSFADVI